MKRQKQNSEIIFRLSSKKRGQMKLSFGMIFSIILIIIFLTFAVYGIMKFLDIADSTKIGKFSGDLQTDIDNMWKSQLGSEGYSYILPSKITHVCFMDGEKRESGKDARYYEDLKFNYFGHQNLFFYPDDSTGELSSFEINHLNITATIKEGARNPYCIENEKGKVKLIIEKNYGDRLPSIK